MTNDQFDALAQLMRLRGGAAQEVARLVLVDGLSVSDASARTGLELRAAYYAVERAKQGLELARNAIGYRYWHMQRHSFGWRQVGGEMLCVMDDFGTLVPAWGGAK